MIGHNSDPPTAPGVRHAVAAIFLQVLAMTTAATMVNDSTMDIWSPRWPPTRWCSLHSTRSMAELSAVRQTDKHFEANGHGYPRPTRDQTDAPAPSPTPARATGSANHEGRPASGNRSSPDAASAGLNLFCVLVSGRRRVARVVGARAVYWYPERRKRSAPGLELRLALDGAR